MDIYQQVIYKSRYARWDDEKKRRENWDETVERYISFFKNKVKNPDKINWDDIRTAIINHEVMPSMRALMTSGKALERDNVAGYNCSYLIVDSPRVFDEAMYILCCGTGVGFSVERQYVNKLPEIAEEFNDTDTVIHVKDSKIGWASAFREILSLLWVGQIPKWDVSKVRPAGAPLKTFGGRASGPQPLVDLFVFSVNMFKNASGRKLTSLECHDLLCKVSEVVVSGGVRRSACISLSNLSDERMRNAKVGQWWIENPQRALSNNSAVYTEKPDMGIFMDEWKSLYSSKSGERGIVNRKALKKQASKTERRDDNFEFGVNPCSEIILRPNQFCNLSEVVVREKDSIEDILKKVKIAAIIGTLQATLTDFRYIRKIWETNCKEEALLGVSLTGIMDNKVLSSSKNRDEILNQMKEVAIKTNKKYADILGIEQAKSVSCLKPSGTVSQLVNSSSGIHARYAPYYIRRVRMDKKDPICQLMIDSKIPYEEDVMNNNVFVFSFPIKSPKTSVFVRDLTAIDQLEHWKMYKDNWCEHSASVTIYIKENEWLEVGAWVYKNFDDISGLSFLPQVGHTYKQAPYEEISEEKFVELNNSMPKEIDWTAMIEHKDLTEGAKEFACTGDKCELV